MTTGEMRLSKFIKSIKPGKYETPTNAALIAVVLFLGWLNYAVAYEHMPVKDTVWALTPPLIAILMALVTREVYSSLFLGVLTGAMLNRDFDPVNGINRLLPDGIITVLSDKWNIGILLFLIILGTMVQMMNRTGGSAAFGLWASRHIRSRVGAQLATVLLGCLIFIDDYFNCLTVGSVMRPVTDKHRISRAKLAYLIDSTAAPVCIIAPLSSWAAAVSGFIKDENGISLFIQSIPFNFYALLTLAMIVLITVMKLDYGPMLKHERNALGGDLFTSGKQRPPRAEAPGRAAPGRVADLVIPVVSLVIGCVIGMIYTGGFFSGKQCLFGTGDWLFRSPCAHRGILSASPLYDVRRLYGLPARGFSPNGSRHTDSGACLVAEAYDGQPGCSNLCSRPHSAYCHRPDELPARRHLCCRRGPGLRFGHVVGHVRHSDSHRDFLLPEHRPRTHGDFHLGLHGGCRVRRPLLSDFRHHHPVVGGCSVQPPQPRHHATALFSDGGFRVVLHLPRGGLHQERAALPGLRSRAAVAATVVFQEKDEGPVTETRAAGIALTALVGFIFHA